jgi:hypothetical protein
MPRGPRGEKRPADVIGAAVMVGRIATGEIEDIAPARQGVEYARKGGLKGGLARAVKLAPERRTEIAKKAAKARWKSSRAKKVSTTK